MKMKTLHMLWTWIFLSGFRNLATDGADIHGYSGENITITCSYGWASTNIKYFCRDLCEDRDVLVKSDQSSTGRYTLKDRGAGTFNVSITDLQESDSGIYWCGVERVGKDTFKEVRLNVSKDLSKSFTTSTQVTQPYKNIQTFTVLHTTTPATAAAHSGSPSTTASLSSRDSSPNDDTLSPSATESHLAAGEISIQGYTKGNITITCSHSWASTNIKYFCRDPCEDSDILVKSAQTPTGRYSLKDYGDGTFTVSITDLQESDSGIYWCGVERVGRDTFKKLKLIVSKEDTGSMEEITHHRMIEIQTSTEMHSTKPRHSVFVSSTSMDSTLSMTSTGFVKESDPVYYIPYAAGGLAIIVIMCAVGLVTVLLYRKRVKKSRHVINRSIYNSHHIAENAPDDRPYATIKKFSNRSKVESQSDAIYENLHFNTTQEDAIYGNL